jgi:hypothetical protein
VLDERTATLSAAAPRKSPSVRDSSRARPCEISLCKTLCLARASSSSRAASSRVARAVPSSAVSAGRPPGITRAYTSSAASRASAYAAGTGKPARTSAAKPVALPPNCLPSRGKSASIGRISMVQRARAALASLANG